MLDDKEFLEKVNQKAAEQKNRIRKKRRRIIGISAAGCMVLVLGLTSAYTLSQLGIFPPYAETGFSQITNNSSIADGADAPTEDIPREGSTLTYAGKIKEETRIFGERLILSEETAKREGLTDYDSSFFQENILLYFHMLQCPERKKCEVQISEEETILTITIQTPKNKQLRIDTEFLLTLPRSALEKEIVIRREEK